MTMTKEQSAQWQRDYQERKTRRFLRASIRADVIGRIQWQGDTIEIRRALRSKGYRSNYEQVPQYWVLYYSTDGKLISGRSLTESAYQEAQEYALKNNGVKLP